MNEIKVLQIGSEDLSSNISLPTFVKYNYINPDQVKTADDMADIKGTDIVFLTSTPNETGRELLERFALPYRLFVTEQVEPDEETKDILGRKMAQNIKSGELEDFLDKEAGYFFPHPYGEKYSFRDLEISRDFKGKIVWNGFGCVMLSGSFGTEMRQAAYFKLLIPIEPFQVLDFWPEYKKSGNVDMEMNVTFFTSGYPDQIEKRLVFNEEQMKDIVHIENGNRHCMLFVSFNARGNGTIRLIALHDRYSRGRFGHFLIGGKRKVTEEREEIFSYYEPGNLKPPLIVFFSGYKTQEGFEGLRLMRKTGAPFLLIAEARLEGGGFYMGSRKFEIELENIIRKRMKELNFTKNQVIMAGISMGTTGAMYYGAEIRPHSVFLGKPLANLGDIAVNEYINRPGGFATSIDVLRYHEGGISEADAEKLNERFWNKFDSADLSGTRFVVAYMKEDDYDSRAYRNLVEKAYAKNITVFGKGLCGRHNDDTAGIVQWFVDMLFKCLKEDFDREDL